MSAARNRARAVAALRWIASHLYAVRGLGQRMIGMPGIPETPRNRAIVVGTDRFTREIGEACETFAEDLAALDAAPPQARPAATVGLGRAKGDEEPCLRCGGLTSYKDRVCGPCFDSAYKYRPPWGDA